MSNLTNISVGEVDSSASTVLLPFIPDKLQLQCTSIPDVSNISLTKRVALMESENGKLRVDLDHAHIELNARIAANEGLKQKVSELYIEIQSVLQEKHRLQNILTDMSSRLGAAETSIKWYQSQIHTLEAAKTVLQTGVSTYQGILKQRQQAITNVTTNYKQLSADYVTLKQKYEKENQGLRNEINSLILSNACTDICSLPMQDTHPGVTNQLEVMEEELHHTRMELKAAEERLLDSETAKISMENVVSKQHTLILSLIETIQKCEAEKNRIANVLEEMELNVCNIRMENGNLQTALLSSKKDQREIEDAILLLQSRLYTMITQYKLCKIRNFGAEEELATMQCMINKNKCLRRLLREANSLLFQNLNVEEQKISQVEYKFLEMKMYEQLFQMKNKAESSLKECLRQVIMRNKDLKEQLKSLDKSYDENIDEGYGDSSIVSSVCTDVPISVPAHSVLLSSASNTLLRSKDMLLPIEIEVKALQAKMERLQFQYVSAK